jgi:hypothetical protein
LAGERDAESIPLRQPSAKNHGAWFVDGASSPLGRGPVFVGGMAGFVSHDDELDRAASVFANNQKPTTKNRSEAT